MRRKVLRLVPVLLAAATACTENPTEPAAVTPPVLSHVGPPTVKVAVHEDEVYQSHSVSSARDNWLSIVTLDFRPVLGVPRFDPTLGDLLSARLILDGAFASEMISHALGPFYVESKYDVTFRAFTGVLVDPVISDLIGGSTGLSMSTRYKGEHSLARFFPDPYIFRRLTDKQTRQFDKTYSGADAQQFVATQPGQILGISAGSGRIIGASVKHSGLSLASFLSIATDPPTGQTKPGVGTLVQVVATLINDSDGHGLFTFSDLHTAGGAFLSMRVVYSYLPFPDFDHDGLPDNVDPDDDNDGVIDGDDAFPLDPTEWSDNDGDGVGDNADPDDDNDGQTDDDEVTCGSDPFDATSLSADNDGDGSPDCVDPDDDNDGIDDVSDNCSLLPNPDQADYDRDGLGDACDPDDDNGGVPDASDTFPKSNVDPRVVIDGNDTGVDNQVLPSGATFNDLIGVCADNAQNHGKFVSCVSHLTNGWRASGLISGREKGRIGSAAAQARIP